MMEITKSQTIKYKKNKMLLCQYRDLFGKPNQGFHAKRLGPFALWDIVATILVAYVLSKMMKRTSFLRTLVILFILAEILHWLFCVDTGFMKLLVQLLK
jgi:hypothetical protein